MPKSPTKQKIVTVGKMARLKQYQNLIEKIKSGKINASEMKLFYELETQIAEEDQPDKPKPKKERLNHQQAADYLGRSVRSLKWHVSKGNLKQNRKGGFDVTELDRFGAAKGNTGLATGADGVPLSQKKDMADLRWRLARAEQQEYITAQLKGNLIERTAVVAAIRELITTTRKKFMLLPQTMPTLLQGKDQAGIMKALQHATDEILIGLSEQADVDEITRKINAG